MQVTEEIQKTLAAILTREINNRGWTQEKFAEMAGLSLNTLAGYFYCTRWPRPEQFVTLSKTLGVSIPELLGGAPSERRKQIESVKEAVEVLRQFFDDLERGQISAKISPKISQDEAIAALAETETHATLIRQALKLDVVTAGHYNKEIREDLEQEERELFGDSGDSGNDCGEAESPHRAKKSNG